MKSINSYKIYYFIERIRNFWTEDFLIRLPIEAYILCLKKY